MDILPTQVCENDDFMPTQKLSHSSQYEAGQEPIQIAVLNIGSNAYPIKKGITKIGRHPDCNIVLYDQTVSKMHAEIEASSCETSVWICDLNSSNKTKLNNSILRPGRCYELKDGTVIEFGMVRAIYKLHYSMDDSLIPETPAPPRQMKLIIPGTPDSSMNNSTALEGNDSVIPSTQGGDETSVFRRPCIPQHNYSNNSNSSNIKKTIVYDFSTDDSMDDSSSSTKREKENVGAQRVSIHDMETQKSFESLNDTDIHDVETQKICTSKITTTENKKPIDIHDMETQNDQNLQMQGNVSDIHEMDTQYDIDINNVMTSRAIGCQNVSTQDAEDSTRDVEKNKTEKTELPEDTKGSNKMHVQNIEAEEGCCSNNANIHDDKYEGNNTSKTVVTIKQQDIAMRDEQTEGIQKTSQGFLQLSLSTNFEDDCSELDKSHNLLGSQNLLEDLIGDDDVLNKSHSKASTSTKSSCLSNNETTEKSTDDESIFDAATQVNAKDGNVFKTVTRSVEYPLKAALVEDDSDDTDQECLFQRYSRIASQDSQNPSKSQSLKSEDSDTDEEGQFTEIAVKEKRACLSFEARQNASKEVTSGDSDDLFEMPTQQVNRKSKNSLTTVDVDFDAPTQVIKTNKSEDNAKMKEIEVDDLAATQILQPIESPSSVNKPIDLTKNNAASTEKDITEMDDNMPTQIMNISETVPESAESESPSPDLLNPNSVDGNSDKDIDYEMAPTQLISEVDKSQSVPNDGDRKNASKKLKETNLNDTLEQNLNDMFEDVNEDDIEDQSLMSTQVLTNILQSSQREDKSDTSHNVDSESPTNNKVKKSPKGRKRKTPGIDLISHSTPRKQNRRSNLKNITIDDESQNAGNYIANLTPTQKQNVLLNSQDVAGPVKNTSDNSKEEEHETMSEATSAMNNKTISVCETLLRSTPKRLSMPRSLAKNKNVELEVSETVTEKTDESKNNKVMLEESSKTDDQISITSVNTRQSRLNSLILNNDDDDILAGLPEVRISGTLSNPASPTTPISKKRGQKKAVPRKKPTSRKSTRKLPVRGNAEDAEPRVSKLNSSPILGRVSHLDGDKASTKVHESDDERITKPSKQSTRKIASETLHKSKKNASLSREKSISAIDSQEQTRYSPPIQSNRKTRRSSKENVDNSSIFQVQNEDLIGNTATEPAKRTTSSSRLEKKSLNSTDIIETSNAKMRKGDANKSNSRGTKGRKSTARNTIVNQNSSNILDYVIKRNSPVNVKDPCNTQPSVSQENLQSKQLVIKIMKVSHNKQTGCLSPSIPTESIVENNNMETKQTRRKRVNKRVASNNAVTTETEEAVQNVRTRGNKSQKVTNRRQCEVEIVCSQGGEESQEVEMIMNGSLKDQSTNLDTHKKTEINEKISGRTRNSRKRANAVIYTDDDSLNSNSSDLVEFDNEQFQRPSSKAKRAKTFKNSSNITNIPEDEPDTTTKTSNKRPFRLTRGSQQSVSDSSMSDHLETNNNASFVKNTSSKVNSTRSRGRQPKAEKLKVEKKQSEYFIEDNSSSEMNSCVDNASILVTPTRLRRSMSSSLSASSPLKVKHKILFTGITNDYSKLLTKLGASQVEDASKCDVLVTDKVRRTVKFLCALAQSVPIVSIDWLIESEKAGHFMELKNYILKDPVAEAKFGFKLRGSLEKAKEHKLLEGYTILLTPNVAPPPLPELKSIISSCGGKALVRAPSSWPQRAVIISRSEDLANAKKFLAKAPKTVTIQSTEFLLTGILRQELNFDKYQLK
ncbi:mediator of DNA damage checkpoint protein 1 [Colletes gigas]|uniref:mediator of DNA damage checkpoint protein 1 n=1 Tax=Colletes gigas TaxID=935657 RepID=UPI001C9AEF51|nr:mediator of DNA damage checkpoint protein 1 [Colletes gigas]